MHTHLSFQSQLWNKLSAMNSFHCMNWGFEQLRDPVYPKAWLGWFFKDHLAACATAHHSVELLYLKLGCSMAPTPASSFGSTSARSFSQFLHVGSEGGDDKMCEAYVERKG